MLSILEFALSDIVSALSPKSLTKPAMVIPSKTMAIITTIGDKLPYINSSNILPSIRTSCTLAFAVGMSINL